jgi:hypothetical protein
VSYGGIWMQKKWWNRASGEGGGGDCRNRQSRPSETTVGGTLIVHFFQLQIATCSLANFTCFRLSTTVCLGFQ